MSVERSHRGLVQRFANPPCGQLHRGFESLPLRQNAHRAPVAQWIEHQLAELRVVGSSPAGRAITWTILRTVLPTPGRRPWVLRVQAARPPRPPTTRTRLSATARAAGRRARAQPPRPSPALAASPTVAATEASVGTGPRSAARPSD